MNRLALLDVIETTAEIAEECCDDDDQPSFAERVDALLRRAASLPGQLEEPTPR